MDATKHRIPLAMFIVKKQTFFYFGELCNLRNEMPSGLLEI